MNKNNGAAINNVQIDAAQPLKTITSLNADAGGSKQYSLPRSCHEIRVANPIAVSENYYIDPDGAGVGDDPVQVFCDMTTGNTNEQIYTSKWWICLHKMKSKFSP